MEYWHSLMGWWKGIRGALVLNTTLSPPKTCYYYRPMVTCLTWLMCTHRRLERHGWQGGGEADGDHGGLITTTMMIRMMMMHLMTPSKAYDSILLVVVVVVVVGIVAVVVVVLVLAGQDSVASTVVRVLSSFPPITAMCCSVTPHGTCTRCYGHVSSST